MSFTAVKNRKRNILKISAVALALYIMIGSLLVAFQEKIIFLPTQLDQDYQYEFDTPFEEFFLNTTDGARLNALHFKAENPIGALLYFHGNAGDLSRWGKIVEPFTDYNLDVIVMDYRTYGKSTGELSEQNLYGDAQLFYDYASKLFEDEVILYGRSLGTGIATKIASENKVKQLILEAPYTSITAIAKHRFPMFPVSSFLNYDIPSDAYIKNVNSPITIFHGAEDAVVPYKYGKALSEIRPETIKLITIEGGGHNELPSFESYQNGIKKVLN